ncbi:hypothetical protein SteCoe_30183 [Stentor coeruleus]|uniref:ADP-ribosylation factor n=1 Tax=Stentor coeruleus TaxID=5963 RepID=A0A1R2B4G5_9CILI|nr:hypothetical protein SteCoe_30183 [Stentor coeruleus]
MLGLDSAGKTTILSKLDLGEIIVSILCIGFLYETIENPRLSMTIWDLGFSDKRPLYNQFYDNAEGIIFVVDSNDRNRISQAREDLQKLIYDEKLYDLPLLIYANKQDIITAMSVGEVADKLGVKNNEKNCYVQGSSAIDGFGIFEGLEWILKIIQDNDKDKFTKNL